MSEKDPHIRTVSQSKNLGRTGGTHKRRGQAGQVGTEGTRWTGVGHDLGWTDGQGGTACTHSVIT